MKGENNVCNNFSSEKPKLKVINFKKEMTDQTKL